MNIVADQLNSKSNTQSMIICYITDMKQYFKKSPLLSEDKTYARILKIAQTTQKYMPHQYCISNIALKLVSLLRSRVDDKLQDLRQQQQSQNTNYQIISKQQNAINGDDIQALDNLTIRLSKQNDASKSATILLGRQINQEFMRKLVIDVIDQLKDQIQQCQDLIEKVLNQNLNKSTNVLFYDSRLSNKAIINKFATSKNIKITNIKISGADPKLNQINLTEVAAKIRKFQKVIISVQSFMKNGCVIAQSGTLMIAVAAKKYNIPVIALGRGFSYTQKVMIDQHFLLADNPMRYFNKSQSNILKIHIAKKFDLIQSKYINQIVSQFGTISPSNIQIHFSAYYDYQ